jgi:hypothetical protein
MQPPKTNPAAAPKLPILATPESAPPEPVRRPTRTAIILWLVAVGMGLFFMPLYFFSATLTDDTRNLGSELNTLRTMLTTVPTPLPEARRVLTPLAQTQPQLNALNLVVPTLNAPRADLPQVMAAIRNYDATQIEINTLVRSDTLIIINGSAVRDDLVLAYQQSLERSNLFKHVELQSLQIVPTPVITQTRAVSITTPTVPPTFTPLSTRTPFLIPTATRFATSVPISPTQTLSPTITTVPTATQTGTVDPRDQYEPDDNSFPPIFFNVSQLHNFFPANDVDTVSFLAKNGRYYRIYTAELAPGVDTVLRMNAGSLNFEPGSTNCPGCDDDPDRPGTLASKITFQNNTGVDVMANVIIANRGAYATDKYYKIFAEEFIPTPTATATATTTPTFTLTPIPTATPTPTFTRTTAPTAASAPNINSTRTPTRTPQTSSAVKSIAFQIPGNSLSARVLADGMPIQFVLVLELKTQ